LKYKDVCWSRILVFWQENSQFLSSFLK
jgi:hypothetical protein